MSNGIGRVWAVNAEGGDEGRPNGVGPVWIENADALGSKLPEPGAGDAGKVLGVLNSSGDLGWVVDQSGTLTQVQSDWNETNTSTPSYIQNKPTIPSGTQLVPAATSADADKVLTVDAQGAPVWATGASYTAGGGVAIENDEISVKVGTGLKLDDVSPETVSLKATSDSSTRKVSEICPLTSDLLQKMSAQNGLTITTSVPFSFTSGFQFFVGLASWGSSGAGSIDKKLVFNPVDVDTLPIPTGTSFVYNTNQIDPNSNTTLAYVQEHISEFHVVIFGYFSNWSIGYFTAAEGSVQVETATYTITDSIQDAICVKNPLPASAVGDAGKILTVNAQGAPSWAAAQSVTVDQVYDASSANAQSGVAVASAVSGKQDTINDLETIRSGAAAGATAVQPAALNDYATTSALTSGLSTKQDTISDLETIRSGAAAGATAVQPSSLATVATTGNYSDLSGKPTIPTVDQNYNAASTNAQSGTAVAGALATVAEVPAVTSSDDDKVLKASYSGGTGSYSWEPGPTMVDIVAGANVTVTEGASNITIAATDTTYTAGNMIAIDANNSNAIGVSTTAGITDIQQVAALPENPVSTVLYLIPET